MGLLEQARAGGTGPTEGPGEQADFAPMWRPQEEGDYIVGTVANVREHDFGYGMTKILDIVKGEAKIDGDVAEGTEFGLSLNTKVLKEEAEKNRVMKGDEIMVVFHGWGKSEAGRQYKKFEFKKAGGEGDGEAF